MHDRKQAPTVQAGNRPLDRSDIHPGASRYVALRRSGGAVGRRFSS
jgi:hypothetical protein